MSIAALGSYVASNSLTLEHPYYEVVVSQLDSSKLTGLGLVHKGYNLGGMPGWHTGSIGWHFDDCK